MIGPTNGARVSSINPQTVVKIIREQREDTHFLFENNNKISPVQKRQPLEHEPPGGLDAPGIGAPVLQPVAGEALEHVEPLAGRYVDELALLDLLEDPGLDQGAPGYADAPHRGATAPGALVVVVREYVAGAENRDRAGRLGALLDVVPVGELRVPLLARPPVDLDIGIHVFFFKCSIRYIVN